MIKTIQFWYVIFITEFTYGAIINIKRYIFDNISGMFSLYLIFLAMFYGLKNFGGPLFSAQRLDALIIGYILWTFALLAYSGVAQALMTEAQVGTLEQLYLSPAGFNKRLFCRLIFSYIYGFILVLIIFFLTMLTTGRWFSLPWFKVFFILSISLLSVVGIGYIMGGLAIVFKRMNSALNIMQFMLIGFVYADGYPLSGFSFLPYSPGANAIAHMVVGKETIPLWWFAYVTINSLVYFFLGMGIYSLFERRAMRLNILSEY